MGKIKISYGRRKKKTLSKVNIMTKKGAKSQAYQINSLANKIRTLEKKQRSTRQYAQYRKTITNRDLNFFADSGWSVDNLVDPDNWLPVFQANPEVANANKLTVKGMSMELYFRVSDSVLPLTPKIITVFLVKLRNETGIQTLNGTNNMSTVGFGQLANDSVLWETVPLGMEEDSLAKLNPACFEIVKVKRFQIQNIIEQTAVADDDTSVTTPKGTYKRFSFNIKMGNLIKANAGKKWADMTSDDMAIKDRLYLLVHQGGAGAVAPPETDNVVNMSVNCTFTCLRS